MSELSVIIPLAPDENAWQTLLADLATLPHGTEILFITSQTSHISLDNLLIAHKEVRVIKGGLGRAVQMNKGAKIAKGTHIWFLHADSQFHPQTIPALLRAIKNYPCCLLYFDLVFLQDASWLMFINNWGVYCRSRFLHIPFGDQGFCIKKELFHHIGGFPEHVAYGEDHVFVWKAHQHKIALQPVDAKLYTSARKYKKNGWLKTTYMHQYLWIKQAWQEWKKLRKVK